MKRCITALFIALAAFPSAARSDPPENVRHHWAPVVREDPPANAADDGFEWSDAGIAALAGTALAGVAIAGAVGLRRRSAAL